MAVDDFDADLADVTEDGYDTNLDAFGPGSGRGEDVGYRGTGEGIYDAGSDSYYMPSRSNIINSDNYDVGFAMNDQLSRGLSGDVFDPAKVQQYNQIAAGFSSQPLNISNQQIMNNSAMLREQGKGLEDIRVDFVKELGSKEGNAAFGNFLSGAFNVSKMGPYSDPMKTSDIGAFGVGLSSLMGDKTANYPMNNYDLVDLAMKQGNFALSGRDPSEFGSLGGIANQFGRDVSAGAKQIQNDLIQLADGAMSYLSNKGKAGDTVENIVADQKRIEIADLEKNRLESLVTSPIDRVKITELDPSFMEVDKRTAMDSGASLASGTSVPVIERPFVNLPPDPVLVNQIQRDIAKSRGIFDLPEAKPFSEIINNTEIDAGENKGQNLYDGSQYNDLAMQKLKNLGYNVEVPNLPNAFNSPTKRPFPGTDEVALRRGVDGYTFANTFNRPLDASREGDPSGSNLTTDQLRAAEFSGFSFDPVTNKSIYDERGPIEFIKKTNFPLDQQGIISLNTDMDYGQTNSLDNLLRNTPRSVAERNFLLNEIRKEKERMDNAPRRYPDSGTAGLPGLY